MCYYAGCTVAGTWLPVLVLRKREQDPGTRVRFLEPEKVATCTPHRTSLGPKDFLSPEGFDVLCRHFRERARTVPERKLVTLEWEEHEPPKF